MMAMLMVMIMVVVLVALVLVSKLCVLILFDLSLVVCCGHLGINVEYAGEEGADQDNDQSVPDNEHPDG